MKSNFSIVLQKDQSKRQTRGSVTKNIFTNIHSDFKNELAPAASASLRQITQLWSHRFSQKINFGNSWRFVESKIYQRRKRARQESDCTHHKQHCSYIELFVGTLESMAKALCARLPMCQPAGQTPGQTQSGSGWTAFCNCLNLCFSCLRNPRPRAF